MAGKNAKACTAAWDEEPASRKDGLQRWRSISVKKPIFVGIDVSKARLNVVLRPGVIASAWSTTNAALPPWSSGSRSYK